MTAWPPLPYDAWRDTLDGLHRWVQIVGKIRTAHTPLLNHTWNSTLRVTPTGLTTGLIPNGDGAYEIEIDLIGHELKVTDHRGRRAGFALRPMSVARFYRELIDALAAIDIADPKITRTPNEVAVAIPFPDDNEVRPYDPDAIGRYMTALLRTDIVFERFRARFIGKASPVHFFWGGFDLAATRFSGRRAPAYTGGVPPHIHPHVMHEAYSHEVISAGFWPGDDSSRRAEYYAYAMPAPVGLERARIAPAAAAWDETRGEFLLPYDAVRASSDPDGDLLAFLQTTYDAAADLAKWDRAALETGVVCDCDPVPSALRWPS